MSDIDTHFKFLQSEEDRNIKKHLEKSIENCLSLKAAVAFFNIGANYFSNCNLREVLSREESFFCVDIHDPTSIYALESFYYSDKQPNFYLFVGGKGLSELDQMCNTLIQHPKNTIKTSDERTYSSTDIWELLHAKLLLFTFEDHIEIWLGSQNFTRASLEGVNNLESTVIITTSQNSKEYIDAKSYLDFLKTRCLAFDKNSINCYLRIQNALGKEKKNQIYDHKERILRVICSDVDELSGEIGVFSFYGKDTESAKSEGAASPLSRVVGFQEQIMTVIAEDHKSGRKMNAKVEMPVISKVFTSESKKREEIEELVTTYLEKDGNVHNLNGFIIRLANIYPVFFKFDPENGRRSNQLQDLFKIIQNSGNFVHFQISINLEMPQTQNVEQIFFPNSLEQYGIYLNYYQKSLRSENAVKQLPIRYYERIVTAEKQT